MIDSNQLNELYEFLQDVRADLLNDYNTAEEQKVKDQAWLDFREATRDLIAVCELQAGMVITKEATAKLRMLLEAFEEYDNEAAD